ncbi:uncharacterized protein LOC130644615 isoform X1 [Hydractinia symbiolongicarpus]|uniref:uncharacterized protein LOC130644615 isoform X1 n=1 Tax=Hydractinia symbiolongicarpus TaxID=13093 RepID=UPI0025510812|nr:uncharacterized protein LOC130644615 isoform X1 [Hydractinia symbiolongicarpus]
MVMARRTVGSTASAHNHNAAGIRTFCDNAENSSNKVNISCLPEYKDYTYNEKQDIWALVSLKAPFQEEKENEEKRAPIDIIAVIDKSGSMAGAKLDLVKRTLEFVLTQLNERDRFSVVTYDTNVYIDFGLRVMTADNKKDALHKIKNIQSGSCTNLCGGLLKGLCQIIDRPSDQKNEVASVLLFTDGLANSGITSPAGIVAAMKDPKRYDGPSSGAETRIQQQQMQQAPHRSWLNIIKHKRNATTSNQTQAEVTALPTTSTSSKEAQASVYTFGFGSDHDPEMLKEISDAGNGMYYFIEDIDQIAECFGHCLGGLLSTVAQGIQLEIVTEDGVTVKDVHTSRPFENTVNKSVKINMGDLQSEENRDIVLELTIESVHAPYDTTPQALLMSRVDYFNVITNELESDVERLTVLRPVKTNVHDKTSSNVVVNKERSRVKMTKAIDLSRQAADIGDLITSRHIIDNEIEDLKMNRLAMNKDDEMYISSAAGYDNMVEDLNRCYTNLSDETTYLQKGKKTHLNMAQQHSAQRCSHIDSISYATSKKRRVKDDSSCFRP